MEWVIVNYPGTRDVFFSNALYKNQRWGTTNRVLSMPAGQATIDLGRPVDYSPSKQSLVITGTSVEDPLKIKFGRG
jgi:hypothetical protein